MSRPTALALLPTRCAVCATPLRTDESRARGLGPECALLLAPGAPPRWDEARRALGGRVDVGALAGHWRRSAVRTAARLVIVAAQGGDDRPIRSALEVLGFGELSRRLFERRAAPRGDAGMRARAAFRRRVSAERLHPDQGGDPLAFVEAARSFSSHR